MRFSKASSSGREKIKKKQPNTRTGKKDCHAVKRKSVQHFLYWQINSISHYIPFSHQLKW